MFKPGQKLLHRLENGGEPCNVVVRFDSYLPETKEYVSEANGKTTRLDCVVKSAGILVQTDSSNLTVPSYS